MLTRFKKMLGIEGAKLELSIPKIVDRNNASIKGELYISSLSDIIVENINIRLIETYSRGRSEKKRINDFELGSFACNKELQIVKGSAMQIPFELPFELMLSEMDRIEHSNKWVSGLIKLAKKIKKTSSIFRVVAEIKVRDTKFNPLVSEEIIIK